MTNEEHIKSLTTLLEMQTKMHETAVDMLKPAIEAAYQKGYNDAMGWKVQNHLEHLPSKPANWMEECADFWNRYTYLNERAQEKCEEQAKMWIEKLRAAQPQPEPEPVAFLSKDRKNYVVVGQPRWDVGIQHWTPLYTAPPQREWVGLTDKDREWCDEHSHGNTSWAKQKAYGRAIEAKLKEKNANG